MRTPILYASNMPIPLRIRLQDWLADRFSFIQYAVPRVQPAKPGLDWLKVRRQLGDLAIGAAALLVAIHVVARALAPRAGGPPVALLLFGAVLAAIPGTVIVLLL
ncbi:hypothetical protein [Luteibacter sp.]|uniref:hypothetical protein n=1 Tax=Luteibacter sp. TaxID=1886636 RepID=UPI0025C63DAE|nr:hypothetical protein [Luteibacter sp.]